jgi:hypothetical protein
MKKPSEISRRAIQAAITLKAVLHEIQEITGKPLTGNQAVRYADVLLDRISPAPSLMPAPRLLTTSKTEVEPEDILKSIASVLGHQTLDIAQITKLLQDRNWLHNNSARSIRYVSDILSRNSEGRGTDQFIRVRRGVYRVSRPKPKLIYRTGP